MCDRLAVLQTSRKDERLEGKSIAPLRTSPDTTLSDRGKDILGHREVRKEVSLPNVNTNTIHNVEIEIVYLLQTAKGEKSLLQRLHYPLIL